MTRAENELMPPSLKVAKRPVFHYTSAQGLLGIVESGCLWASEASSLNDLAEVRRGWDLVRGWLDERRARSSVADALRDLAEDPLEKKHEVFVLSGSTAADDANQWRLYAQEGSGYAVELNPRIELVAVSDAYPPTPKKAGVPTLFGSLRLGESVGVTPWHHVLYTEAEAATALRELVRAYKRGHRDARTAATAEDYSVAMTDLRDKSYAALAAIAHLIKEPGFSGEREVRIVTTYLFADKHIRYRPGPHGVVSYGLLTRAPKGHDSWRVLYSGNVPASRPGKPLPVRSVRLGPLLNPEHVSTVERLLATNDLKSARVKTSNVRLR